MASTFHLFQSQHNSADYEPINKVKFSEIPITIIDESYVLFAVFICMPGINNTDIAHYTTGIRINDKWEIYDDLTDKPFEVNANKEIIVHAVLYLKK